MVSYRCIYMLLNTDLFHRGVTVQYKSSRVLGSLGECAWNPRALSMVLALSLVAGLVLITGGGVANARDEPSKESWNDRNIYSQHTKLDPKNSGFPLGSEWDIAYLAMKMFGYTGGTYVAIVTMGGFPLENGVVKEPYFVVKVDTNGDKKADLSLSTKGVSYSPDIPIQAESLNGSNFSNCEFKLRSSYIAGGVKGKSVDTLEIGWSGCKQLNKQPIGVRVEIISEGKVLDVFPNKGSFVRFNTDYNAAWPCNASKKGKMRVNWLRKPSYSSYCSFVGGAWTWTKTKQAEKAPSRNIPGPPPKSPKK